MSGEPTKVGATYVRGFRRYARSDSDSLKVGSDEEAGDEGGWLSVATALLEVLICFWACPKSSRELTNAVS